MCLVIKRRKEKIAEDDITVYKLLHVSSKDEISSVMYTYSWKKNKLYNTELKESTQHCAADSIEVSNLNRLYGESWSENMDDLNLISIGGGFHSCLTLERALVLSKSYAPNFGGNTIFQCIIPKGAKYYKNKTLIVSDKLIIKKRI